MSHVATKMPHLAPFEGSRGHGAHSDGYLPANIEYPYIQIYGQTTSVYLNLWVKLAM
jgi:hypothetical protein